VDNAQVALSLTTNLASGVVSGIVTFRLNARRDARRVRREKLEELFLAHTGFLRQLDMGWFPYFATMKGEIEYNQALDLTIERGSNEEKHFERVEMLVTLYFPELLSGLSELVAIRDEAARVISQHREQYKRVGPHETPAVQAMGTLSARLTEHQEEFRSAMARVARRLGASNGNAA
jgi:hypothetical protein